MSTPYRTVATYRTPAEAELARGRLEAEGIPTVLIGDLAVSAFAGLGDTVGGVQLQVPEAEAARARGVLVAVVEDARTRNEPSGLPLTRAGKPAWVCPRCAAHVDLEIEVCPSCGTLLEDPTASTSAMSLLEEDPEEVRTWVGDHLAARALRAAVFGLFIPLLGLPYSLWLLLRLNAFEGELSPSGRRKMYWALFINCAVLAACLLLAAGVVFRAFG